MEKIVIPANKLQEGFDKQKKQIIHLIKTSELLFEKRRYASSIAFSVLADEETTKLRLFSKHLQSGKPVRENEWKPMTRHIKKLTIPVKTATKNIQTMPPKKKQSVEFFRTKLGFNPAYQPIDPVFEREMIRMASKFDKLKQDCFYLSVHNGEFFSIITNLGDYEQKTVAYFVLTYTKVNTYTAFLTSKFTTIRPQEWEKYLNSSYAKTIKSINKERNKGKFKQWYFDGAKYYSKYYNK